MKFILTLILVSLLLVSCKSRSTRLKPVIELRPAPLSPMMIKEEDARHIITDVPQAPRKKIVLKKINDSDHSDNYMYPEDSKSAKKDPVKTVPSTTTGSVISKEECIAMISQEKFDKYSAMFGSEAASIKRCTMLKAMRK